MLGLAIMLAIYFAGCGSIMLAAGALADPDDEHTWQSLAHDAEHH